MMRYRIYYEWDRHRGFEHRETPEGAILRAQYLIDHGAAGVEIWDRRTPDRIYLPRQFDELLSDCRLGVARGE